MARPKILVVDDEKPLRDTLVRWFRAKYDCLAAPDAQSALDVIRAHPDLALMISDVRMPGDDGVTLLRKAKELRPDLPTILLTAYGTVDLAVEAMKDGADDFFQKPITDIDAFEVRVDKALRRAALGRAEAAPQAASDETAPGGFTGASPAMERVYSLIRRAAPATANVLVTGPSGTGKELVARALHTLSPRAKGPFVAVECAALSSTLLESELFGYEPKAFSGADQSVAHVGRFEAAAGGTLFLDEIGEIDLGTQVKLLRVLESRVIQRVGGTQDIPVDFRLVAATNRDLRKLVEEGAFREDLYYRLNVIDIVMPALKDRPGDVARLVTRFLREFSAANGNRVIGIEPQALKALEGYAWPGNVRQLRNVMEKMVVLAAGPQLGEADLPAEIVAAPASAPVETPAPADAPAAPAVSDTSLEAALRARVMEALAACGGNRTRAAEQLGISRRTLHRKLKEWNP